MKLHLFQELLALNQGFDHVIRGLERMGKEPTYKKEMISWAKAHVESAQVEANRQFFDEFDAIVENDAIEAYKFLCDHKKPDCVARPVFEGRREVFGLRQKI
jgi:hypothetical protein